MALRDIIAGPPNLHHKQIRDLADAIEVLLAAGGSIEVFDADEVSLGTVTGIRAPDISIDGDVAVFPNMPLVRTDAQLSGMSPPLLFVLYANSDTGKLQYFDGAQWIVLGAGGGVIGIPPGANVSWNSDIGVTGSPASAWESIDTTVTLAQASGSSRPAVTAGAFGSTQGLTFDGVNDNLSVAVKVVTETGAATVSIVFKTAAAVTGPQVLLSQSDTAVANDWFEIGIGADGRLYVESNAAGTKHTVQGSTPLLPSTVYNLILCYDGTDYFLLLNGVEENPLTIENIGAFAWFGRVGGTTAFTVGANITSGGVVRPFAGVIGGVYFWDEDLTA